MNKLLLKAGPLANKLIFKVKKHSPEILLGAGIVGTVTSTVLACKATLKVNDILAEKKQTVENIHMCLEDETVDYTKEDKKKDLTILYTQTGVKMLKLYAPSIILGTLSIGSIIFGHKILRKRNIAIAAAYTAVDQSFKKYRKNVVDKFGEAVDKEMKYGIKAKEITTKDKDGNKVKETVYESDNPLDYISEYARFFDESCSDYTKDPNYNLMFLRRQQDYANEVLKCRGHLFLNEVYDMIGIPRSSAGQVVGWIYDKDNPKGDNYVDFGLYTLTGLEVNDERKRAFINGQERSVLLDFNVDGVIYDMI